MFGELKGSEYMGFAVKVSAYFDWSCTYFVQTPYKEEAKRKAYEMAKGTFSCYMPKTIEEAENDEGICIEVLAEIERIIL